MKRIDTLDYIAESYKDMYIYTHKSLLSVHYFSWSTWILAIQTLIFNYFVPTSEFCLSIRRWWHPSPASHRSRFSTSAACPSPRTSEAAANRRLWGLQTTRARTDDQLSCSSQLPRRLTCQHTGRLTQGTAMQWENRLWAAAFSWNHRSSECESQAVLMRREWERGQHN